MGLFFSLFRIDLVIGLSLDIIQTVTSYIKLNDVSINQDQKALESCQYVITEYIRILPRL